MQGYRLYFFDRNGHIARVVEMECASDDEAIERVREYTHAHAMELWQQARCIGMFEPGA